MSGFHCPRGCDSTRKDYEPFTLIDTLLEADADGLRPVRCSCLKTSLFGVRARSDGKTSLTALKAMRREHPVLAHCLYTYLSVMAILRSLITATAIGG